MAKYIINAAILGYIEWCRHCQKWAAQGLTEYETVTLDIEDLDIGDVRRLVNAHEAALNHNTDEDGEYEGTTLTYNRLRTDAEHARHKEEQEQSYKYWVAKLNKAMAREVEYREQVRGYVTRHGITLPGLKIDQ